MHFTLWSSLYTQVGAHAEIPWAFFLDFLRSPNVAADKKALEGWSPIKARENRRGNAHVELVSALVLDDDGSGLPLERVVGIWGAYAGAVHTTYSHTVDLPRYRIVLQPSRDMQPEEYRRVWAWLVQHAAERGQVLDHAVKDPSRFWYVPGHAPGAPYAWWSLTGAPLDVDAILALGAPDVAPPRVEAQPRLAPALGTPDAEPGRDTAERQGAGRRHAMAAALSSAWPGKGRHQAQLALAGALRAEGWAEAEAVDFLTQVAGDRTKREATCRHTWGRPPDAPLTGWTRLKQYVDPVLVEGVRGVLGRDGAFTSNTQALLESLATAPAAPPKIAGDSVTSGALTFLVGGLDAPLPALEFQIDPLICKGDVVMLVAHGNSLKTWTAFSLGLAVATGRPWLGRFMTLRGRVALLDYESGDYEVKRRLKLLGVKDAELEDRLLRSSFSAAQLIDPDTWISLAALKLDLLVIDSFAAANRGQDENDARAADTLQLAGTFADKTACTVIVIHHARKGDGGDAREIVRGSSAIYAACDRVYKFQAPEKKEGGIVLSTMTSVKDGAGRTPPDVRVELSDQGLKYVEIEAEPKEDEKPLDEINREIMYSCLQTHSTGIPKIDLLAVLKGKNDARREFVASMKVANILVEYKSEKMIFIMLNPNTPRT